jgi:hypothetical protein
MLLDFELGSHAGEAVKELHFLPFRERKINGLRVKNGQFWRFFYSLWCVETRLAV